MVELLLKHHADPKLANDDGKTPDPWREKKVTKRSPPCWKSRSSENRSHKWSWEGHGFSRAATGQ